MIQDFQQIDVVTYRQRCHDLQTEMWSRFAVIQILVQVHILTLLIAVIVSNQRNMASEEHVQGECNQLYLQINFYDLLTRLHFYMMFYPKQNFKYIPILVPILFQIPKGALRQPPSRRSPDHLT